MAALHGLLKRASSFLNSGHSSENKHTYADGEIVFSKNNVCVHTPSQFRKEGGSVHHPGYLVVRCRNVTKNSSSIDADSVRESNNTEIGKDDIPNSTTLTLTWIPNEKLARNHDLISQLHPDACHIGNSNMSRSCSTCLLSDPDSISMSSYCCHTDTPCTASIASKSFEESTALISSDISTTEPATLSCHEMLQEEETTHDEGATLPALANDGGSHSMSSEGSKSAGVLSTSSSSACINEARETATSENLSSTENGSEAKREDDTDTGIFLESGSSVSTEIKDMVANALNEENNETRPSNGYQNEEKISSVDTENATQNADVIEDKVDVPNNIKASDGMSEVKRECSSEKNIATEESLTSTCGVEDTSFDSSPEPHVPTYDGIFCNDASEGVWFEGSAESMAYSANLAFPEWTGSVPSYGRSNCGSPAPSITSVGGGSGQQYRSAAQQRTAIFNVDLGEMRSLRLFFSDGTGTRGQLVIASRESQYKILHFHHTGLDKLASVFEDWNFLVPPHNINALKEKQRKERAMKEGEEIEKEGIEQAEEVGEEHDRDFKQFSVCRPSVEEGELHPDEGSVSELDAEDWLSYFSSNGVIEDELSLRRRIFFGGLEAQLRSSVWPFLLRCYPYNSTFIERQQLTEQNRELYDELTQKRNEMAGEEREEFWRTVQCTVEKDVVRTDRNNPCFAGQDNPNLTKMKNILLNFAVHRPDIGYTQGMSDILAPILSEVRCEPDVFWCFTGLMSKTIFVTSPRDLDMEMNLKYLRELLKIMAPGFYAHIMSHPDGRDLLFCHRWILLCFKREFPERSVLSLWEACWSNYQTDYFHLFVSVAVVCVYGSEVTEQNLRPDETLLYFTSLAHHMDANIVIKKARGLLHQFRSMAEIPCSLVGLCELCGPGMWDSGHNPTVRCEGHGPEETCPNDLRLQ